MATQETHKLFEQITGSLEQKQVKQAVDALRSLLSVLQNWQLQETLDSLEDTYKTMLRYSLQNIQDPDRNKIYNDLIRLLYQTADTAFFQLKTANENLLFYERKRSFHFYVPESASELLKNLENIAEKTAVWDVLDTADKAKQIKDLSLQKETVIRKLFYSAWLSNHWSKDEKAQWKTVLAMDSNHLPALIITAVTLNLMETFDENKAALLFESAQNTNEDVQVRALTGIALFLRKYDKRLHLYPGLVERLNQLAEDPIFLRKMRHVVLQFIVSRDTEKITRKITDELIPEMMQKLGPKIGQKMQINELIGDLESDEEGKNPEWQDLIEQSGMQEKLQEISDLQMEGADVMHSSFIHLKNYPFFNEPSNWFMPFSMDPAIIDNEDVAKLSEILKTSTLLCNSDKYSFFFSVEQMPSAYRKMMIGQFSSEMSAVNEAQKTELKNASQTIGHSTRQYIQDLYRFYKLHPKRKDFEDIFATQPEFYKVSFIENLLQDKDSLLIICEYYFNRNYYADANELIDRLLQIDAEDAVLYQKKAYCLQMTGQLMAALDAYQKAEFLNANHSWTLKKLAHLHRILKNPQEALLYYKKAEQFNPDNLSLQLNIGHCHLELQEYEQALKYYFKVEYLSKNKEKAWRPLAWTSFLMGKYQQAADYYHKILETSPTADDYLNAGHVQLVMHNAAEAIRLYALSWKQSNQSQAEFASAFADDIPHLSEAGVDSMDLPFILDSVFYS
ncbi:MAG: hypothetical protein LBV57_05450 [Candidatus Symbiothrix sp.]|jgi:tetratricopeptide (TPR) repeat protein|nr:hypothetical protein [Candidatus Symbiothrix sp.]